MWESMIFGFGNRLCRYCAVMLLAGAAVAQTTSTQILGTVTDPSGAAVQGAAVQARRTATGELRTAKTNDAGDYIIPALDIGGYEISAQAAGFQREIKRGIELQTNQKARIDFQLIVGSVTDTVEVNTQALILKTDDATLGDVVERKRITELPLNGRNFAQLAVLASPGVQLIPFTILNGQRVVANGQRENQNQITMDGIVIQNNLINSASVRPSVDAMEEFKVQTGNFSAEFGNYSGAQVNIALRSGANAPHLVLFEFLRNDKMDARSFFERPTDLKAPRRINQFGGVISGPVFLPKIYNGHDKTFFMFNTELLRNRVAGSTQAAVMPDAFRNGDFSSLLASGVLIRDPLTGQAFPGNLIPANRISPQAAALLKYIPTANRIGTLNFQALTRSIIDNNQYLGRIDHVLGPNDKLFGHYVYQTHNIRSVGVIPNNDALEGMSDRNVALTYTRIFSPTVVNELRLGWHRFDYLESNQFTNTNFSILKEFGMIGFPEDPFRTGLPGINISGYLGMGSSGPAPRLDDTGQISENLTVIRGKHTFKTGVDIRLTQEVEAAVNLPRGSMNFVGQMTNNPAADFLLGLPREVSGVETLIRAQARNWKYGAYFQDDWRVSSKLTLNLGVRYQLATVARDPRGSLRSLDPSDLTKLYPPPGTSAALYRGDHNNFAPRVGFAYRPFGAKTVIRGGFGLFYNSNQLNNFTILVRNPPSFQVTTLVSDPARPSITLANPFAVQGLLPTGPFNIITIDSCACLPQDYTQTWTLNIQQQLTGNLGFEVGYVGSRSVHLNRSDDVNQPLPGPGSVQSRRPIPNWAAVRMIRNDANATYNALQSQLRQRFSKGLLFVTNYAWSHSITDGEDTNSGPFPMNFRRRDWEKANSRNDQTHIFNASMVYELPFKFRNGWLNQIGGGWQVNAIVTLSSGLPFTVFALGDPANTGSTQRADRLADGRLPAGQQSVERWFDTSAFANPAQYTYGTAGRLIMRRAGTKVLDFGLYKNFRLAEGHNLQFRSESFSLLNTPQFGAPGSTVNTPAFGRVGSATGNRNIQFSLKYMF